MCPWWEQIYASAMSMMDVAADQWDTADCTL